jgi:hypothetical protein
MRCAARPASENSELAAGNGKHGGGLLFAQADAAFLAVAAQPIGHPRRIIA